MKTSDLIKKFPEEKDLVTHSRPYFNHSIEFKNIFTPRERADMLDIAGLNMFFFPSEMITGCDLLSDSGTTSMTNEQWAALHLRDEAYGSNRGYFLVMKQIIETFGEEFFNDPNSGRPNAFIFHQGRPAEDALFTMVGRLGSGLIIPGNGHFDTTQANIKRNNMQAVNLFSPELMDESSGYHFKGDMDLIKFKSLLERSHNKIPLSYLTITNNTGGGQPVSMENIRDVSNVSNHYDIPLFFDACRFAENAWFIQQHEPGYGNKDIKTIVKEMFSYVDGFTISFKKDGLVNMGGGLFLKDNGLFMKKYPDIPDAIMGHQIDKEGHPTYGGLSGRDIMTLAVGLKIATKEEYLTYRINQVKDFGENLKNHGLPVMAPIGGHAVYLDMNKFFADTAIKPEDFGGVAFTAVLLAAYGHRTIELGNFSFGSYDKKTKKEILPEFNFVRFAIPRLRYEKKDLDSVAEAVKILYENRDKIPPVNVTYGRDLPMRHFKARFEFRKYSI
ncbi:MAG: tryptophanase [Candidatus Methanoperedens sp.]|nr:tryptophanase [Candidatus Methanoperedens sp.]CAG0991697.1 tryptophanase [Methanosarcinales archaeon]